MDKEEPWIILVRVVVESVIPAFRGSTPRFHAVLPLRMKATGFIGHRGFAENVILRRPDSIGTTKNLGWDLGVPQVNPTAPDPEQSSG